MSDKIFFFFFFEHGSQNDNEYDGFIDDNATVVSHDYSVTSELFAGKVGNFVNEDEANLMKVFNMVEGGLEKNGSTNMSVSQNNNNHLDLDVTFRS